jgi:hypothetical protein
MVLQKNKEKNKMYGRTPTVLMDSLYRQEGMQTDRELMNADPQAYLRRVVARLSFASTRATGRIHPALQASIDGIEGTKPGE